MLSLWPDLKTSGNNLLIFTLWKQSTIASCLWKPLDVDSEVVLNLRQRAISCAPRGQRFQWLLKVQARGAFLLLFLILYPAPPPPPPLSFTQLAHTQLCHTLSFTHNFLTHNFASYLFHTQLAHTHTHNFVTYNFVTRTTFSHTPSFTHSFVTYNCHTQIAHTQPHNFATHTQLVHTQLCHTQLAHTQLCHIQLCHTHTTCSYTTLPHTTLQHAHNFVTRHLSHTQPFHIQLAHTHTRTQPHNFATHTRAHNFFTHTQLCHTQLCHTPSFTHSLLTPTLSHTQLAHTQLARTWRHPPSLCVAGMGHRLFFAWQAWHLATCTVTLCGGRGTWRHPPSFCVAGVALGDIDTLFAWQVWHLWRLAGRRGTLRCRRGAWRHPPSLCVAGVAASSFVLRGGARWSPVTPRHFVWQAWRLATSTVTLLGAWRHPPSVCVAGAALVTLGWLWWRAWGPLVAGDAAALCVLSAVTSLAGGAGWHGLVCLGPTPRFQPRAMGWRLAGHMPMVGRHEAICNMPGQCPAGGPQIAQSAAIAYACCVNSGSFHVLLRAPSGPTWCCFSSRWPGLRDDAVVCAWGQRSVFNRVWQQGLWANAPCWAHTEALAVHVLATVERPALLHRVAWEAGFLTQLWHTQLLHTQLFYTQLSDTQLVHTHTQIFKTSSNTTLCAHNCFTPIHHTHTHTTPPRTTFFNLSILHHLLCLSFLPRPTSTLVSHYWKKLTCGVIWSFN